MLSNIRPVEIGRILDIKDNIISVSGLRGAFCGELVYILENKKTISGFVLNLETDVCRIPLICGDQRRLRIGDYVYRTNEVVKVKCG